MQCDITYIAISGKLNKSMDSYPCSTGPSASTSSWTGPSTHTGSYLKLNRTIGPYLSSLIGFYIVNSDL